MNIWNVVNNKQTDDSDIEFWEDIEDHSKMTGKKNSSMLTINYKPIKSSDLNSSGARSPFRGDNWKTEYFQDKIERVRQSNEPRLQSSTIKVKNQLDKEYATQIEQMKEKYKNDICRLTKDFKLLKSAISAKDANIHYLIELIADVHLMFSESTLNSLQKKQPLSIKKSNDKEKEALAIEVCCLREQIEQLKDICQMMQKERDAANQEKNACREEFVICMKKHEAEIMNFRESLKEKEKAINDIKDQMKAQ